MNIHIFALGTVIDKTGDQDGELNLFLVAHDNETEYPGTSFSGYALSSRTEISQDDVLKSEVVMRAFPKPRTARIRHIKTGGLYHVVGTAPNVDLKKGWPNSYVLYLSFPDHKLYARTLENFHGEGIPGQERFEYL